MLQMLICHSLRREARGPVHCSVGEERTGCGFPHLIAGPGCSAWYQGISLQPNLDRGIKHCWHAPSVAGLLIARSGYGNVIHLPGPPPHTTLSLTQCWAHTVLMQIIKKLPLKVLIYDLGCTVIFVLFLFNSFSIMNFSVLPFKLSSQYLVGKLLDGWILFTVRINIYKFQSWCWMYFLKWQKSNEKNLI